MGASNGGRGVRRLDRRHRLAPDHQDLHRRLPGVAPAAGRGGGDDRRAADVVGSRRRARARPRGHVDRRRGRSHLRRRRHVPRRSDPCPVARHQRCRRHRVALTAAGRRSGRNRTDRMPVRRRRRRSGSSPKPGNRAAPVARADRPRCHVVGTGGATAGVVGCGVRGRRSRRARLAHLRLQVHGHVALRGGRRGDGAVDSRGARRPTGSRALRPAARDRTTGRAAQWHQPVGSPRRVEEPHAGPAVVRHHAPHTS